MFISLGIASSILGFISGFLYFFLYMALGGIQPRSFLYSAFAFVSFYGFKLLKEKSKKGLLLVFTGCVGMYFSLANSTPLWYLGAPVLKDARQCVRNIVRLCLHSLRVEFLLKSDCEFPRDAGVFFHSRW